MLYSEWDANDCDEAPECHDEVDEGDLNAEEKEPQDVTEEVWAL